MFAASVASVVAEPKPAPLTVVRASKVNFHMAWHSNGR
ncbi:hypothetical protein SAMN05443254_12511 [Bradyrhizobium sp. OK095]|nr:hypothetical protein SAMN05443254_12511 [Bradyrhizobium sp. OK095]